MEVGRWRAVQSKSNLKNKDDIDNDNYRVHKMLTMTTPATTMMMFRIIIIIIIMIIIIIIIINCN